MWADKLEAMRENEAMKDITVVFLTSVTALRKFWRSNILSGKEEQNGNSQSYRKRY